MANSKGKCSNCGKFFPSESLMRKGSLKFHSKDCLLEYATRNVKRLAKQGVKKSEKEARAKLQERKKALRPLKWYADKAQAEFNRYIRLRDKGRPCVSCGKPDDGTHQRHASHYRSRGACSFLRFDEANVHASCAQCNNHLSGNIEGFTPELIKRIGQREFDRIMQSPKSKRYTIDDLNQIIAKYKMKCKEMKND